MSIVNFNKKCQCHMSLSLNHACVTCQIKQIALSCVTIFLKDLLYANKQVGEMKVNETIVNEPY